MSNDLETQDSCTPGYERVFHTLELDLLVPGAAGESHHYLLPVEVLYLLAGFGLALQGLLQQVVGLGRRVVGIPGDLLDLVGVRLVSEVSERGSRHVRMSLTRRNAERKCVNECTPVSLVGERARLLGQQRHVVGVSAASGRFDVLQTGRRDGAL